MIASSAGRRESASNACDGRQLALKSILLGLRCLDSSVSPRDSSAALGAVPCLAQAKAGRIGIGGAGTKLAFVAAGRRKRWSGKRATYPTNQATIHEKKRVSKAPSHRVCRRRGPPEAGDIHCRVWATAARRCGRGMLAGGGGAILRWAGIERSINQWDPGSRLVIDVAAAELPKGGRGG